jgi:hypothetical protein
MDIAGNLTRCCTIPAEHGNLFTQEYRFDATPGLCGAVECGCPYQGMKFADGRQRLSDKVAILAAKARTAARRMAGSVLGE